MVNTTLQPRYPRKWDPLPIIVFKQFLSKSTVHADSLRNFKNLYVLYLYEVNSDMLHICGIISLSFRNLIYSTDGS